VAVIATGDELLSPSEPARPGALRDSNSPLLCALIEECGARVVSSERIGDDPGLVVAGIERALEAADVVITMGGVSAGAFDPVKLGAVRIPGIRLWRVAMKPGRPQAFGAPRGRLFFGLPGNPGSVACVFEALVRPALRRLQGFSDLDRPRLRVRSGRVVESRSGRTDFVRVVLAWRDGAWWAEEAGAQVSGHLTPQSRAHALLIVPEGTARLAPGDEADALLLRLPGTA
jgi:molybdopterin molybdotransferase